VSRLEPPATLPSPGGEIRSARGVDPARTEATNGLLYALTGEWHARRISPRTPLPKSHCATASLAAALGWITKHRLPACSPAASVRSDGCPPLRHARRLAEDGEGGATPRPSLPAALVEIERAEGEQVAAVWAGHRSSPPPTSSGSTTAAIRRQLRPALAERAPGRRRQADGLRLRSWRLAGPAGVRRGRRPGRCRPPPPARPRRWRPRSGGRSCRSGPRSRA
jgi:hypothetical protein